MTESQPQKVFVSHASQDEAVAAGFVEALENNGIDCWYAPRDIGPRRDFAREIPAAFDECEALVLLLSDDAMASPHVRREMEMADRLRHKFYPIRLHELELTREFTYFLRVGEWLDIDENKPETTHNRLVRAVREGKGLRRPRLPVAWIAGATIGIVAIAAVAFFMFQPPLPVEQSVSPAPRSATVTSPQSSQTPDNPVDAYANQSSSAGMVSTLKELQLQIGGLEPQKKNVLAAAYAQGPSGKLVKIGEGAAIASQGEQGNFITINAVRVPESYQLCLIFQQKGPDGAIRDMVLRRTMFTHTMTDPAKTVQPLTGKRNCDSQFSVSDRAFDKNLAHQHRILDVEKSEVLVLADDVRLATETSYKIQFHAISSNNPKYRYPKAVTSYLFGSADGRKWRPLFTTPLVNGRRLSREYEYRRKLPTYVRSCAVTELQSVKGVLQSEKIFRRAVVSNGYEEIKERALSAMLFDKQAPCASEAARLKTEAVEPIEEIISASSGGKFSSDDQQIAINALKEGRPMPFGPTVNGVRLGMPFDAAVAAIKKLLPMATISELPAMGPFQRLVYIKDGQRFRTVTLAAYASVSALAGATFTYTPKGRVTLPKDVLAKFKQQFRQSNMNVEATHADSIRVAWGYVGPTWCSYSSYSQPILLAAYDPLKCTGLFVESRVSMGGRGSSYSDVGLFDWNAVQAVSK